MNYILLLLTPKCVNYAIYIQIYNSMSCIASLTNLLQKYQCPVQRD